MKIKGAETKAMRARMAKSSKVKITINIDEDILNLVRDLSQQTGVPYQKLLNKSLREHFSARATEESRLDVLEREVKALKRRVNV